MSDNNRYPRDTAKGTGGARPPAPGTPPPRPGTPPSAPPQTPKQALGAHLRTLRESTRLSLRQYVAKHAGSITSISAYENGERLPRKAYLDTLHHEIDQNAQAPLTPDVRRLTHTLYRNALPPKGEPLTDLYDAELHNEELTYKLEASFQRAQDLQRYNEQLKARMAAGATVHPGESEHLSREGTELLREQGELTRARQEVQRRIEHLERLLPLEADTAVAVPPRPATPPSSYGPPPQLDPVLPPPWWPVPPPEQPSHQGKSARKMPWILVGILALAVALLAGIVLRPALLDTSTASATTTPPAPQGTVTATVTATPTAPSAPASPSTTATEQSSPPPSADGDSSGWKVEYRDTSITMPESDGICGGAVMDFEPLAAAPRNTDDFEQSLTNHDLMTQNACFTLNSTPVLAAQVKRWGNAAEQPPTPAQCLDQASRQALGDSVPLSQVHVGSAYCLVTQAGSLVWFKVTAKPGINHQGLTITTTLWIQNTH